MLLMLKSRHPTNFLSLIRARLVIELKIGKIVFDCSMQCNLCYVSLFKCTRGLSFDKAREVPYHDNDNSTIHTRMVYIISVYLLVSYEAA